MGTIRAVPMSHDLTLAEQLLEHADPDGIHPMAQAWEIGRLVLDPGFRGDVDALRRCLYLAMAYLQDHRRAEHLYATCTPELARLYRRFGFQRIAAGVPLRGTDKTYSLIHGLAVDVIESLGRTTTQPVMAGMPTLSSTTVTHTGAFQ